jgi:DNA-binding LacI/PurR family transcriptional regulator
MLDLKTDLLYDEITETFRIIPRASLRLGHHVQSHLCRARRTPNPERSVMVTIKHVAREAGLSVTTVSRALSDYDDVAESTKEHIREVARRLDYHPNTAARSLQTTQANALGLVIPSTLHRAYDPFWLEFIGGMAAACAASGLDLSLSASADGPEDVPEAFRRWVRGRRVDGLVVCDVRNNDQRIEYLKRHRVPFVAFGRTAGPNEYSYIDIDGTTGVLQAVLHLVALGHRRIAYLGLDPSFGFSRFRLDGYREAIERSRLPYDVDLVHQGLTDTTASGAARQMCTMQNRPTAVFCAADFLALEVLRAARTFGLVVPDDLSLVVFDDNLLIQHAEPPLTAVSQPNRQLGEDAAGVLIDRIKHPDGQWVQRLVAPSFVVRSSTVPPRTTLPMSRASQSGAVAMRSGTAYEGQSGPFGAMAKAGIPPLAYAVGRVPVIPENEVCNESESGGELSGSE